MTESSESKPKFFEVKKYAVVFICFIDILILVTYAALSGVMADELLEHITNNINVNDQTGGRVSSSFTDVICLLTTNIYIFFPTRQLSL